MSMWSQNKILAHTNYWFPVINVSDIAAEFYCRLDKIYVGRLEKWKAAPSLKAETQHIYNISTTYLQQSQEMRRIGFSGA